VAGPSPNTNLESFQCLDHPTQLRRVKVPTQLDAPALGQYHRHCAGTFTIRCAAPTDYFDSHQLFAIALDLAWLGSFSLEPSLQRAQRHSVDPAELASRQATCSELTDKPLDLLPRAPPARFNFFGFRHPSTSANSAEKW
jgi:hypothetical protein